LVWLNNFKWHNNWMTKIGLFGGSFNPPHQGHIYISKLAIKKLGLNQLWWIPAAYNPFKDPQIFTDFNHRLNLCQEITQNSPKIKVKNFEKESIYTEELLRKVKARYKNCQFYLIIGADNLVNLHRWKNFTKLLSLVTIVVFNRGKFLSKHKNTKAYQIYSAFLKNKTSLSKLPKILIFKNKNYDISSTEIRAKNA
jgi:nicotinate-nucleotide adenylyltransferase